ncbi:hypothetical protein RHGRI_005258 [Rhododendron griersonianum]|uniref:Uncharacterized protein n=1 Tax=Rhododendron griersonianum TaxID=479676 RepID=A0AAV6LBK6_9ERIC|nr:hypothetical protein RHGRI_005258 [Rhododendron griersonianum]
MPLHCSCIVAASDTRETRTCCCPGERQKPHPTSPLHHLATKKAPVQRNPSCCQHPLAPPPEKKNTQNKNKKSNPKPLPCRSNLHGRPKVGETTAHRTNHHQSQRWLYMYASMVI